MEMTEAEWIIFYEKNRPLSFSWTFKRKETLSFNQQDYPWVLFEFLSIPVKVKHIRNSWLSTIHIISKPNYGWTAVFYFILLALGQVLNLQKPLMSTRIR